MTIDVTAGDPVVGAAGYVVTMGGTYEYLQLVPCKREVEGEISSCAFLGATVAGLDPAEVSE